MAAFLENNLTVVFYTANVIGDKFMRTVQQQIRKAAPDVPIVSVSKVPMGFGVNLVVDTPRSYVNIYRQALLGAKRASTKYIALCEDDVLYSPEHFKHRPLPGRFAYNLGHWGIYTWNPSMYSWKGRRTMCNLICERQLFIDAMEERFKKYPNDKDIDQSIWGEPGKYERHLGVTPRESETFYTNPPNLVFSHEKALAYNHLATRKRFGELRAYDIPYWGHINEVKERYGKI